MELKKDFSKFSAQKYLEEYYTNLCVENQFLMKAYNEIYSAGIVSGTFLEVGGGPTIYQLIAASKVAKRIYFTDVNYDNIYEVCRWFAGSKGSFDWNLYFQFASEIESIPAVDIESRLRSKDITYGLLDIFKGLRISSDIVASSFCLESITDNEDDYLKILKRLKDATNNVLVMSALRNASYYDVCDEKYVAYPITLEKLTQYLQPEFIVDQSFTLDCDCERGYDGMIVLKARRIK